MTDPLESRLRERLAVPDARVEAILAGARRRILRGWLLKAAAAFLLPLLTGAGLLALPAGPEPETGPPVLVLAREGGARTAFYAPPGLGQLRRESDAAVTAEVLEVTGERVRLALGEVVYGPVRLSDLSVPEESRRIHSCTRILEWKVGERCLLFLWRDPETGTFEVRYGGGGKITFPWAGIFDRETVVGMVRSGTVPVPRLVDLVERHGPHAVTRAMGELATHPDEHVPVDAAPVQDAIARWLLRRFEPGSSGSGDAFAAIRTLAPERLATLPERVRRGLRDVATSRQNLYTRLEWLLPLVRAGIPGAIEDLADWQRDADRVVPRATNYTWTRALARARAAQARWEPEAALPRLWEIYESVKLVGGFDRADVLELLLEVDPARAGDELLAYTDQAVAAGYAPPLDLLARLPEPRAVAALRSAVLSPELGAGWYREELREAFLAPGAAPRLRACAPAIVRRIESGENDPKHLAAWVTVLAESEIGLTPVRDVIREALGDGSEPPEDRAALVRAVQDALGQRWLLWLDPTREELRAAEAEAARALR